MNLFSRESDSVVRSVASIRAMRLDNITVDGLIVPAGWLAENGIAVSVKREPSAFKPDGSIARAGECWQNVVTFSSAAIHESNIFYLPGYSRNNWTQGGVDAHMVYILDKHERGMEMIRDRESAAAAAESAAAQRAAQYRQRVARFFELHGKPAREYRANQLVATKDGLIWKVTKGVGGILLIAHGEPDILRPVAADEILVPASPKHQREFHALARGVIY
jgi:hypothetical protein